MFFFFVVAAAAAVFDLKNRRSELSLILEEVCIGIPRADDISRVQTREKHCAKTLNKIELFRVLLKSSKLSSHVTQSFSSRSSSVQSQCVLSGLLLGYFNPSSKSTTLLNH